MSSMQDSSIAGDFLSGTLYQEFLAGFDARPMSSHEEGAPYRAASPSKPKPSPPKPKPSPSPSADPDSARARCTCLFKKGCSNNYRTMASDASPLYPAPFDPYAQARQDL